jgi:hypothetical protein
LLAAPDRIAPMKTARIALLLMLASGVPAVAQTPASDCTSVPYGTVQLFVGISTETVAFTCGSVVSTAHVIRVDLGAPGLSFATSGPSGGGPGEFVLEPTTSFLQRTGSQVAFNANLFTVCCTDFPPTLPPDPKALTQLIGLEISGGRVLSPVKANVPPSDQTCTPPTPSYPFDQSILVTGHAARIEKIDNAAPPQADVAVTGSHLLVQAKQNVAPSNTCPTEFFGQNARTLVGLDAGNGVLWIAAVDRSTSHGVTLPQAAQLMIGLGAATAINLDGGGSTSLVIEDGGGMPRLLNLPNDPPPDPTHCTFRVGKHCARYVGASFGIHAQRLTPPAR